MITMLWLLFEYIPSKNEWLSGLEVGVGVVYQVLDNLKRKMSNVRLMKKMK